MREVFSIISNEGVGSFVRRAYRSAKRRCALRLFCRKNIKISKKEEDRQRKTNFNNNILFSIIVPVYNTPVLFLKEMIESCIIQTYSKFELCIADASDSSRADVGKVIKEFAEYDSRIKYIKLKSNGGISYNTNEAIKESSGDYIVMLDHDDRLHPAALYECMRVIESRNADFIYTDELVFEDVSGRIIGIHNKPDFSEIGLRGNNYICHLSVYSRGLLDKTGMYNSEFDGSQDHDMTLRLTEVAGNIVHIPKVLYYWRCHGDSVASGIEAKEYAVKAGRNAVAQSLKRRNIAGNVKSIYEQFPTVYKVDYSIMGTPVIDIAIWGTKKNKITYAAIMSLTNITGYPDYNISIAGEIRQDDICRLKDKCNVYEYNNAAEFYNGIVKLKKGKYCVFMDGMCIPCSENWIQELLGFAQEKGNGAVGMRMLSDNKTIRQCGVVQKNSGALRYIDKGFNRNYEGSMMTNLYARNMSIPSGDMVMIDKESVNTIGGFDFVNKQCIVSICLKLTANGYRNVWTPFAEAVKS